MSPKNPHDVYKNPPKDYFEQDETENGQDECIIPLDPDAFDEMPLDTVNILNEVTAKKEVPVKDEAQEAYDAHLRALAEMENYKKRLAREHEEQLTYAAEKVLASLLPTLDNLDLALQYGSKNEACKDLLMGVEMTRKIMLEAVKNHGLEPVGEVGEVFDPQWHEGITFEVRPDMNENCVSSIMQRGYKLKGRLLRPAKVGISKS